MAYYLAVSGSRDQFVSYLKTMKSKSTVDIYSRAIAHFEKFMHSAHWTFDNYPTGILSDFVAWMSRTRRPRSVAVYLYGVKQYLRWLRNHGRELRPYEDPIIPKPKSEIPLVLSEGSLAAYIEACTSMDEPYASAMRLLGFCTLRVGEFCSLYLENVIPTRYGVTLRIIDSKSGSRTVPTPKGFSRELRRYLTGYRSDKDSKWLFPMKDDSSKCITTQQLRKRFRIVREKLGIAGFTPHTIRRTWLSLMLQSGTDLITLANIAGHKNLNTTRIYAIPRDDKLFSAVNVVDIPTEPKGI